MGLSFWVLEAYGSCTRNETILQCMTRMNIGLKQISFSNSKQNSVEILLEKVHMICSNCLPPAKIYAFWLAKVANCLVCGKSSISTAVQLLAQEWSWVWLMLEEHVVKCTKDHSEYWRNT